MLRSIGDSNHFLSFFFFFFFGIGDWRFPILQSAVRLCCQIWCLAPMCTCFCFVVVLILFSSFEGLRIYSYLVRGLMVCLKSLSSSPRIIIVFRCWEGSATLTLKFMRMFLTKICLLGVQYFSLAFWEILTCLFLRNAYFFCMLCNLK